MRTTQRSTQRGTEGFRNSCSAVPLFFSQRRGSVAPTQGLYEQNNAVILILSTGDIHEYTIKLTREVQREDKGE